MKLNNQINGALILLLHSSLIVIGTVAAYFIPSTEDQTTFVSIPLEKLLSQNHTDAELHSWLKFLELPHEETLFGKDTLSETLDKNDALRKLAFFSNVAASDHVDYLADRISASAVEDEPCCWKITLQDISQDDAYAVLNALRLVQQQQWLDQAAALDPPIQIPVRKYGGNELISPGRDRLVQFGKACPPAAGGLLAVILAVVAWALWMPSQRKLPFPGSIILLLVCTFIFSFVGAGIGYLWKANSSGEWETELSIQLRRNRFWPMVDMTPETQSLTERLNQKLATKNFLYRLNEKAVISRLVKEKGMTTWKSFQKILKAQSIDPDEAVAVDSDLLCDYILDRLEIEQDPDARDLYTFRFRSEDKHLSHAFLTSFVDDYSDSWEEYNESVGVGGQLTRKYEVHRLSNPRSKKLGWPPIASPHTFQGAFIGAIFTLVVISSTRVFAGAPPI